MRFSHGLSYLGEYNILPARIKKESVDNKYTTFCCS